MIKIEIILIAIATLVAAIPVIIWLTLLFRKGEQSKKTVALVFGIGCFTAPALLLLQYFWNKFPQFNLAALIDDNVRGQNLNFVLMFILFATMEEIIKIYVVTQIDKRTLLIQKISDSIRYSLAAALGFAFTENVYYIINFWPKISIGELTGMYIFRSIFTTCAHMIFSGIFGYFYGIGKYSIYLRKQEEVMGYRENIAKIISKIFRIPLSQAYQQKAVLKGMIIAVTAHATYNFLLQYNKVLPVLIFVVLTAIYMYYLMNRKAGHLILSTDITNQKKSTMARRDEDVVIELLGMWFQEKKYVDVMHVCERLLERDPDNTIVKLFKAQAMDKMDSNDIYKKILGTVVVNPQKNDTSNDQMSKYLKIKEQYQKDRTENEVKTETPKEDIFQNIDPNKNPLDKFTGEGTFKI